MDVMSRQVRVPSPLLEQFEERILKPAINARLKYVVGNDMPKRVRTLNPPPLGENLRLVAGCLPQPHDSLHCEVKTS